MGGGRRLTGTSLANRENKAGLSMNHGMESLPRSPRILSLGSEEPPEGLSLLRCPPKSIQNIRRVTRRRGHAV